MGSKGYRIGKDPKEFVTNFLRQTYAVEYANRIDIHEGATEVPVEKVYDMVMPGLRFATKQGAIWIYPMEITRAALSELNKQIDEQFGPVGYPVGGTTPYRRRKELEDSASRKAEA